MRRGSRLATRRWRASISRATSSTRSGTTPSLHARHNTPHVALNCACVLSQGDPTGSFGSRLFEDGERLVAMFGEVLLALDRTVPPASMDGEGGVSQGGGGLGGLPD